MHERQSLRLRTRLATFTIIRMAFNTAYRMVYPFLPIFARGLGVSLGAVALAVTVRSSIGLASPLLGSTADVYGRKKAMLLALILFSAGLLMMALWPSYAALFAALALSSLGKILFDPAVLAYVGDQVDFKRRGFAVGLTELAWSGAFLVGVPSLGWLMARGSWTAPFPWLAAVGLVALLAVWLLLPPDPPNAAPSQNMFQRLGSVLTQPSALGGLASGLLISAANESVTIIYGAWMESAHGLQVAALGAATAIIGLSELGGEGLVAIIADRLGIQRAVILGILASAAACLGLPFLGQSLIGALGGLFAFYLTFEFTIVSTIPLMTEISPGARATLLGSYMAALSGGRVLGDLIGPQLFGLGFLANGLAAAGLNLAALVAMVLLVKPD